MSNKTYIIAEVGGNHDGDLTKAIELVKQAKSAGASAVKFQKRDAADLLNFGEKIKTPNGYLS